MPTEPSPADTDTAASTADGLLPRLLTRLLFRTATVVDNRPLPAGLHLITLQGPSLQGLRWTPGDKLQLKLGPGLSTRTYTPIDWDARRGATRLLAHALAVGPGSEWARRAGPGQVLQVLGPRRSLPLERFDPTRSVVVGDETALGLAAAWRPRQAVLECGQCSAVMDASRALDLRPAAVARRPGDTHVDDLIGALGTLSDRHRCYVLVGRALTVQRLVRTLRREGVSADRLLTKAYWADGKTGLD